MASSDDKHLETSRGKPLSSLVVVGASAGGVEALKELIATLPDQVSFALAIVLHLPANGFSQLPRILNRYGKLKATHPESGELIQPGNIYIAPPDHHLVIRNEKLYLTRGPKENNSRPSIDVLFRTAAYSYGPRVIGAVLSGTLDDGTAGLIAIKERGGICIAQNPEEAMFDAMPKNAIEYDHVDYILNIAEITPLLLQLAERIFPEEDPVSEELIIEARMNQLESEVLKDPTRPGDPSPFACPQCSGVLWELGREKLLRFRCRTGHAYSVGSLLAGQSESLESALWSALRALEEKAALFFRLAERARTGNRIRSATRFQEQGQTAQQSADIVRQLLMTEAGETQGIIIDDVGAEN